MLNIQNNISLKPFNTFGINVNAKRFVAVKTISELQQLLVKYKETPLFLLGGGSNMLLTKDIEELVVHLDIKGKQVIDEDETHVWVKANAGENWHEFVLWCIAQDFGGLENMSLIPGNVGTAPIQNIGAYGKELKDNFVECEALKIDNGLTRIFNKEQCKFGYRNSIFKTTEKGNYIITSVTFKLTKHNHKISTSYGAIQEALTAMGCAENPSIKNVSDAVIKIRQTKLPDPKVLGNSGSFFKNPVISKTQFDTFSTHFPEAPNYKVSENEVKIPAGWLIEQAGFKGKRFGDAGIHDKQALVLVNHANATGKEIWDLALKIKATVFEKFGIHIDPEVNVY